MKNPVTPASIVTKLPPTTVPINAGALWSTTSIVLAPVTTT